MTTRGAADVVTAAWRAVERHEWEAMDEHFAPEYVRHTGGHVHTLAEFKRLLRAEHEAFSDLRITLDTFVEQDDRVAFRWSSSATHLGMYLGVPPTRKQVSVSGITISRVADGRIAEDWASWNKYDLLDALGITPIDTR